MASIQNPTTGLQVTVPDETVESYTSRGWVRPGAPAPAERVRRKEPQRKFAERKAEVLAAIDAHDDGEPGGD